MKAPKPLPKLAPRKVALRPLDNRLVLRRLDAEEETVGGIYIPDIAREKAQQFEVVAVGPGRWSSDLAWMPDGETSKEVQPQRIPVDVIVGERVLLGKYSGTDVTVDGIECTIVREEEVLAVIEKRSPAE
jgi:chaperonin GroES